MNRALSLALAFVLALTLTACGKKDTGTDSDSNVPADALTLLNTVWDSYTDDEKFPAAGGDYEHSVDGAPGAFDISDTDNLTYLLSVPAEDADKLDDAASLMHMMNANTFTCAPRGQRRRGRGACSGYAGRHSVQAVDVRLPR